MTNAFKKKVAIQVFMVTKLVQLLSHWNPQAISAESLDPSHLYIIT